MAAKSIVELRGLGTRLSGHYYVAEAKHTIGAGYVVQLKLTKDNEGKHHFIPLDWVTSVDDKVHVNKPGDEVMKQWTTSPGGDAE